jgi:hypothetical protein
MDRLWRFQGDYLVVPVPERHVNVKASVRGPKTHPLLFTGLRCQPSRLVWEDPPDSATFDLILTTPYGRATFTRQRARKNAAGWLALFDQLEYPTTCPGASVDWTITPRDRPGDAIGGCFWILEERCLAQLEEAEKAVARVEDVEIRAIAQAITAAEFGLYDEAVSVLDALVDLLPLRGRGALAHRAFVTIFAQMQERMPTEANGKAGAWVQERLESHRDALMRCLPVAGRHAWRDVTRPRPIMKNEPVLAAA